MSRNIIKKGKGTTLELYYDVMGEILMGAEMDKVIKAEADKVALKISGDAPNIKVEKYEGLQKNNRIRYKVKFDVFNPGHKNHVIRKGVS